MADIGYDEDTDDRGCVYKLECERVQGRDMPLDGTNLDAVIPV